MPVIPVSRRLRQKHNKFAVSLNYNNETLSHTNKQQRSESNFFRGKILPVIKVDLSSEM
jgi:hypothetical protein